MHEPLIARPLSLLAGALLLAAAHSGFAAMPIGTNAGILTGEKGMTLYTFDKDVAGSGKSACTGPCAANWPPLMAGNGDNGMGDYSIVVRDDGAKQWAYKGKPLYYWSKDQKPGDRTGDGFKDVWHAAKP